MTSLNSSNFSISSRLLKSHTCIVPIRSIQHAVKFFLLYTMHALYCLTVHSHCKYCVWFTWIDSTRNGYVIKWNVEIIIRRYELDSGTTERNIRTRYFIFYWISSKIGNTSKKKLNIMKSHMIRNTQTKTWAKKMMLSMRNFMSKLTQTLLRPVIDIAWQSQAKNGVHVTRGTVNISHY